MYENYVDFFIEGSFYPALKCIYQILNIRVNIKNTNKYITTCFALCKNKKENMHK